MQTPTQSDSLLTPIGYMNGSCGYCGKKSGSFSYYASSLSLSPEFYLALLDRGWRRSGTTLYKPDLATSCCPHYTIRLNSHEYRASKTQRQTLNRFNRHILGDEYAKEAARLHPKSREEAKKRNVDFDLVERVHEPDSKTIDETLRRPPEPAHELTVTLEAAEFTEEKYGLFENYQRTVHHEPPAKISRTSFKSFLCTSPLTRATRTVNGKDRKLGSYHQCYRIDGELIAIGVLDLLPQCVSAVYFMYHDSVHQLALGKVGALREIALAKEEDYGWWYAGFYIHSCAKMRYKGDYAPQYILDPESYGWDLLDDAVKKRLDANKYLSLSRERAGLANPSTTEGGSSPETSTTTEAEAEPNPSTDTPPNVHSINDSDSDYNSDSDSDIPNPHLPLYARNIPGIMTKSQLLTEIDIDCIKIGLRGIEAETSMLVGWQRVDIDEKRGVKALVLELVAAVGGALVGSMRVVLG